MGKLEIQKKAMTIAVPLTVLAVVFSQFFYYQAIDYAKLNRKDKHQQERTETQQESKSEPQVCISLPSSSLPSATYVVLHQVLIFLFEISFEEAKLEPKDFSILIPPNRFFKTLFDSVISPNAP
ncbi:MAG: hypothetical protein OEV74_01550 [Cyclobacteriaceae bacterium]|nr:hypothetical protein [Cyclobacteriaceae bacterium]MDH4294936.1 hypothetical protein [Cyclobacteriaceae bacterium]MDH5249347.1 hypothetical protein [Cyclobacteriaceae bacterium]